VFVQIESAEICHPPSILRLRAFANCRDDG